MAFDLSEFSGRAHDDHGGADLVGKPDIVYAQMAADGRTPTLQEALQRFVVTDQAVRVLVYTPPQGTDSTVASADGSDGLSEYFPVGEYVRSFGAGHRLAVKFV